MKNLHYRSVGMYGVCLLAIAAVLSGCPKKPTQTTTPSEKVTPPPAAGSTGPDTPAIESPSVREQEIVGAGKPIDALKLIYFEYDKSEIRDDMKPVLQSNAQWLLANKNVKAQIAGHCDERGTNDYNLALGSRRADAVKRYLIALGVPSVRLSTISYGEERPACTQNSDDACYSRNRRAQFAEAK
jgi:peptidoglycan-associated lipoprotein